MEEMDSDVEEIMEMELLCKGMPDPMTQPLAWYEWYEYLFEDETIPDKVWEHLEQTLRGMAVLEVLPNTHHPRYGNTLQHKSQDWAKSSTCNCWRRN